MSTATNELQPAVSCIRQRFESQFSPGCLDTTPAPTFTNRKKTMTPQPLEADGSSVGAHSLSAVTATPGPENRKRALPPTKPKPPLSARVPTVTITTPELSEANDETSMKGAPVVESNDQADVFVTPIDTASVTTDNRRTYFRYSNAVSADANDVRVSSPVNKKVPPVPAARPSKNLTSSQSVEDTLDGARRNLAISVTMTAPAKTSDFGRLTEDVDSPHNTTTVDTDNKRDFCPSSNVADRDTNDVILNVHDSCQVSKKELPVPAARPSKNTTKSNSTEDLAADRGIKEPSLSVTAAAESEIVLDNVQNKRAGEFSDTGVVVATSLLLNDSIDQPVDATQPEAAAAAAAAESSNEDCLLPSQTPETAGVELPNSGEIAPSTIVMNKKGTLGPSEKSCQPEANADTPPLQSRPALIVDGNDRPPISSSNSYDNDNVDERRPVAPASGDQSAAIMPAYMITSMINISTSQPMASPRKTSVDDTTNKHSRNESSSGSSDIKSGSRLELLLMRAKKALRLDTSRKTRDEGESKKADVLVPATAAAASISAQQKTDVRPSRGAEAAITSTTYAIPALGRVPRANKTDDVKIASDAAAPSTSVEPLQVVNTPPHASENIQKVANDDTRKVNQSDRGVHPAPPVRQAAKVGSSMTDLTSSGSSAAAQQSQVTMTSFQLEDKHRPKSLDIDNIGGDETTKMASRQHNAIDRKSSSFNVRSNTLQADSSSCRQGEVVRAVDIIGRESVAPTYASPETQNSRTSDNCYEKSSTVCTQPSQQDICCAKELKLTAEVDKIAEPATETHVINQRRPIDSDMPEKTLETLPVNASKGHADVQHEAEHEAATVAEEGLDMSKAAAKKRRSRNLSREQSRQNFSLYITNNFEFLTEFEADGAGGAGDGHQSNYADDPNATESGAQVKAEELQELNSHENVSRDNCAVGMQSSDTTVVGVEPSPSDPKDRARLIRPLQPTIVATSRESYARLSKLIGNNFNFLEKFEFDDQLETESATDDVGNSGNAPTGSDCVSEAMSTLSGNVCSDGHASSESTPSDETATDCRPSAAKRLEALRRHSRQSADDFDDEVRKRLSLGSVAAIDTVGAAFSFLDIDATADDV